MIETAQAYLQQVMNLLGNHPLLQVGAVMLVSLLIAKFVSAKVPAALTKLARRFNSPIGEQLADMTTSPLFFLIFLTGAGLSTRFLPYGDTVKFITASLFKSILIIIIAVFILRVTKLMLSLAAKNKEKFHTILPTTLPLFENIAVILIAVGAVHQIFSAWNVNMTALLASAGIVGLALGMAAKDTLSDVFSGVLILTDGPYQLGDFIEIDPETKGTVTHIGIRNTRILTRDNVSIVIPNAMIGNSKVFNRSSGPEGKFRVRIPVFLPYGTDLKKATALLNDIGKTCSKAVCETPTPKAIVTRLGESHLELLLLCWVADPIKRMSVLNAANQAIYEKFGENNIEFAHDRLDLNIVGAVKTEQDVCIKESPIGRQVVHIKDMPDLFGRSDY
ncbi:MAG TPA: mechanosensitive ion channel family protein [Candidatus Tenderia electrophaga]|uniref:Small-conductance mechanosensitive channel n=1 Tax=Candidatus Tenderia electrophaga TaxID=1748243 RepID=A0A832N5W4_9GAMM|nr:mechanosensitive ion channel family protein [Candidatus Tenderia electrophaga]